MNSSQDGHDEPRYHLTSTPRGDIVFWDGDRHMEIGSADRRRLFRYETVLFAASLRRWSSPYHDDEITPAEKERILSEVTRLIKLKEPARRVVVEW